MDFLKNELLKCICNRGKQVGKAALRRESGRGLNKADLRQLRTIGSFLA